VQNVDSFNNHEANDARCRFRILGNEVMVKSHGFLKIITIESGAFKVCQLDHQETGLRLKTNCDRSLAALVSAIVPF
jgi:hypothetical protein